MSSVIALALALQATTGAPTAAELFEHARAASQALREPAAALRAGYRRIGPDSPEMGQHWIQMAFFVDAKLDYKQPTLLTYASINGKSTLTGVAYALPLAAGEPTPLLPDGLVWHEHSETIHRELVRGVHHDTASSAARLAMLHVWTGVPNPDGPFVEANWALPFARVGLTVPDRIDVDAARAISLANVGEAYYSGELVRVLGSENAAVVRDMVTGAADRVRAELGTTPADLTASKSAVLAAIWRDLVKAIVRVTPAAQQAAARGLLGERHH